MSAHQINSIEDALSFLSDHYESGSDLPEFEIKGLLAQFTAKIEGQKYHSSVPAELARGLWEFQSELYRAVAFALYGVDNMGKLTAEQRTDFQLNFEVSEGCTGILASLEKFLEKLGDGIVTGIATMDSKDKKVTIITIAFIIATALGSVSLLDSNADVKKEEIKASVQTTNEQEKTKQFELIARITQSNAVAARFNEATTEGTKAIIKGASDADKIKIGKVSYDRDEIKEVTQRATKEKASAEILSESFVIIGIESREKTTTKLWLAKKDAEFPLVIDDEAFDADSQMKIWEAARNRKPISLELNATIIRGQIKSAQLVKVL